MAEKVLRQHVVLKMDVENRPTDSLYGKHPLYSHQYIKITLVI